MTLFDRDYLADSVVSGKMERYLGCGENSNNVGAFNNRHVCEVRIGWRMLALRSRRLLWYKQPLPIYAVRNPTGVFKSRCT